MKRPDTGPRVERPGATARRGDRISLDAPGTPYGFEMEAYASTLDHRVLMRGLDDGNGHVVAIRRQRHVTERRPGIEKRSGDAPTGIESESDLDHAHVMSQPGVVEEA